jgi:outer membrane porin, OprD family
MRQHAVAQHRRPKFMLPALALIALLLDAGAAVGDEPAGIIVQEEPWRDRLANAPFFRDTTLELHPRTYYYVRDKLDGSINQAWAGGGWLAYHSGLLGNIFHIGATLYTSQPIVAPDNQGGTLLLTSEQDPINTLGVAYLGAKFWGQDLIAGRQMVDTPLINRRDNRMIPITFEGATIRSDTGKDARFEYIAGYLQRFRPRDSNDFDDISQGFGVNEVDRGTPFAWFRYRPNDQLSFAAENYWVEDIINTGYVEAIYKFPRRSVGPQFELAANLITQNSVGSDLLTGSSFFTTRARRVSPLISAIWPCCSWPQPRAMRTPSISRWEPSPTTPICSSYPLTTPARRRRDWAPHSNSTRSVSRT